MPHIRRALIMAAGRGTRMEPLTLQTPKPLVPVHGTPMIENVIQGLQSQGIREIGVITGYKKEQFSFLPEKYPGVQLIENPYWNSCNNISSLYSARDWLNEVLILDGDQILRDPSILKTQFDHSGYAGIFTDEPTDEWLMTPDAVGFIENCSRTGGSHGYRLLSVSWWSQEDGEKLKQDLEKTFVQEGRTDLYWDDVALFCCPDRYRLKIHPIPDSSILEIDSLQELAQEDPAWADWAPERSSQ